MARRTTSVSFKDINQVIEDELKVFCREAVYPFKQSLRTDMTPGAALIYRREAIEHLLNHLRETDIALQSLTPGGSEYVNDAKRCVAFVKDRIASAEDRAANARDQRNSYENLLDRILGHVCTILADQYWVKTDDPSDPTAKFVKSLTEFIASQRKEFENLRAKKYLQR